MMRPGAEFAVSDDWRRQLEAVSYDRCDRPKYAKRAQFILSADDGLGTMAVMTETDVAKPAAWRWQGRFAGQGADRRLHDMTLKEPLTPTADLASNRSTRDEENVEKIEHTHA